GSVFLSFSGLDPEYWRTCAGTFIVARTIQRAIERGDRLLNFSGYPDDAKLRWSEQYVCHHQFAVVAPRRSSKRIFGLYWMARARGALRRNRVLQQESLEST